MPVFRISFTYEMHTQREVTASTIEEACQKILDAEWQDMKETATWPGKIVRWDNAFDITEEPVHLVEGEQHG